MKLQLLITYNSNLIKLMVILLISLATRVGIAANYPQKGNFQQGAIVWAENCGRCHNFRSANELTDIQWITTVFHMRVRAGLTGQESRDVLTFLQESNTPINSISTNKTDSSMSALSGKQIYNQTCIACHGADGTGGLPGVPNFTNKSSPLVKTDDVLLKHIIDGFQTPDSLMAMPPKGGNPDLSKKDVQKTLIYIRKQFSQ